MKTKTKSTSLVAVATIAGVAFFVFSTTSFSAFFQSDLTIATVTAAAIVGFAFRDYSRRAPSLVAPATIVRPIIRLGDATLAKTTAYRATPARKERIAA